MKNIFMGIIHILIGITLILTALYGSAYLLKLIPFTASHFWCYPTAAVIIIVGGLLFIGGAFLIVNQIEEWMD